MRGLSSIIILETIMELLTNERGHRVEPWEEFDMIGGTGTGGSAISSSQDPPLPTTDSNIPTSSSRLIAIMLGRLRMGAIECEETYAAFADAIFTPRLSSANPRGTLDFVKANGRFDERPLEDLIKRKLVEADLQQDALFKDNRNDACKV